MGKTVKTVLVVATLLLVGLVAVGQRRPDSTQESPGRFSLVAQPGQSGKVFVIDSQTGDIWLFSEEHLTAGHELVPQPQFVRIGYVSGTITPDETTRPH